MICFILDSISTHLTYLPKSQFSHNFRVDRVLILLVKAYFRSLAGNAPKLLAPFTVARRQLTALLDLQITTSDVSESRDIQQSCFTC
jgi:hypothetical protein